MRTFPLLIALASLGCQEPFGTDRHDLVGLRVAAIGATAVGDDALQLELAAVVEGRAWADQPLQIHWFEADDLSIEEIADLPLEGGVATGPRPEIAWTQAGRLAVIASDGSQTWRGTVDLPAPGELGDAPAIGTLTASSVDRDIGELTGDDLDLSARRDWTVGEAIDSAAVGEFVRFEADVVEGTRVRWMSTAPGGTFLGVQDGSTDWTSASFVRDDEEIEDLELEAEGARTFLALAMDPAAAGANAWQAREFFVGEVPTGVFTASGRFLPTDVAIDADYVRGELVADDDAPSGVRLQGAQAATADEDPGTDALTCAVPGTGPFDPNWLLAQRCARADVLGASVVIERRP